MCSYCFVFRSIHKCRLSLKTWWWEYSLREPTCPPLNYWIIFYMHCLRRLFFWCTPVNFQFMSPCCCFLRWVCTHLSIGICLSLVKCHRLCFIVIFAIFYRFLFELQHQNIPVDPAGRKHVLHVAKKTTGRSYVLDRQSVNRMSSTKLWYMLPTSGLATRTVLWMHSSNNT